MSNWTSLILAPDTDIDDAWSQLESYGLTPLFTTETPYGVSEMVLSNPVDHIPADLSFIKECRLYQGSQDINWQEQWQEHGHNYYDGHVHVSVGDTILKLMPGPGFGDLSHPTTHLALEMMSPYVPNHVVLDIGSGSGILTLAAAALGASRALGVDIDPKAIEHARQNAILNSLEKPVTFTDRQMVIPDVIVINMIWSEQRLAWQQWADAARQAKHIIVSGILITEREAYLDYLSEHKWSLQDERKSGEWLALHFIGSGRD